MISTTGSRIGFLSNFRIWLLLGLSRGRITSLMEMIRAVSMVMGRSGTSGRKMRVINMAGMSAFLSVSYIYIVS